MEFEQEAKDSKRAGRWQQREYDGLVRKYQKYQDGEEMEREMEEKDAALMQAQAQLAALRASVKAEAMQIKVALEHGTTFLGWCSLGECS